MKVALGPSPPFEEIGGVSTHVYMLARGLRTLGHSVSVVSDRPPRVLRAPLVSFPSSLLASFSQYAARRWTHCANGFYYFMKELISDRPGPDVINIQNVAWVGTARYLKMLLGSHVVLTVHGFLTYEHEYRGKCKRGDRLWNWLWNLEATGYGAVDHIVAVSRRTAEYVEQFHHAPITVIHNGLDTTLFRPAGATTQVDATSSPTLRLLFAGVLEPHKGLIDAIEVLAALRRSGVPAVLSVAGRGVDEPCGRHLAQQLGVDRFVTWLGTIPKSHMPGFYGSGDVLLVPSKPRGSSSCAEEAFGYTALEAMACGLPVVAYRTGGLTEQIVHGKTGYLVPECDTASMAAAVHTLLDPQLRREMGQAARRRVEERFSAEAMARRFVDLYHEIIGRSERHDSNAP